MGIVFTFLIICVFVFIFWMIIKIKKIQLKSIAFLILFLLLFIFITGVYSLSGMNVSLKSPSEIFEAGKLYMNWLSGAFDNIKSITANVIRMDWKINHPR